MCFKTRSRGNVMLISHMGVIIYMHIYKPLILGAVLGSFLLTSLFLFVPQTNSKVFLKRDEALRVAFPEADRINKTQVFLSEGDKKQIETLARTKLDSKLYVFYEGMKDNRSLGYAIIDTHYLRTKSETVMFVLNPDGSLRFAEVLAFFEPPEYMMGENWVELFYAKGLDDSLQVGKDIPNITGATITSTSFARAMRKILAIFQVARNEGKIDV